jgi:hypothetical protein
MREWLRPFAEIATPTAKLADSDEIVDLREHLRGTPGTPAQFAGVPDNTLKSRAEHREHLERRKNNEAAHVLRDWHGKLIRLDDRRAPSGCSPWWPRAVEDACWIYENFASRAVRDGWSERDLFGVWPAKPGWGGLTCRLRGARNLKMDRDRAVWSLFGVRNQSARGDGDHLAQYSVVPLWELQR